MIEVLGKTTVVSIYQYISISNQHFVHLNFTQCHMSTQKKKKEKKEEKGKKYRQTEKSYSALKKKEILSFARV